jgi:hypothetical protein
MKVRRAALLILACFLGCTPPPKVKSGKFDTSYTLTMQRGSVDVVVQASGPATYAVTNYAMDHPMGPRPDTEATFVTPAGKFVVSDRNLKDGLTINGTLYPERVSSDGRTTITIDAKGQITVEKPKAAPPQDNKP